MIRKLVFLSLILALIALPVAACAPAAPEEHEKVTINILTVKAGTSSHLLGFETSRLLEKYHPWLRATASDTPGSTYNTEVMAAEPERWPNTIAITGGYKTLPLLKDDPVKYKALADIVDVVAHSAVGPLWFQTFDPDIRTPEDLVGKRIGLGTKAQTYWGQMAAAELEAWGVIDKVDIEWLGTADASRALIDGAVDVCVAGTYAGAGDKPATVPGPPLFETLATGREIYYIAARSEEEGKKALIHGPIWGVASLHAGTIEYQEKDIYGLAIANAWAAHKSFPEDIAYELVNFYLENYEEFYPAHALFKALTPTMLGFGSGIGFHQGSIKAFKEYAKANPDSEAARYWKKWGLLD